MYNWQLPTWPQFQFDTSALEDRFTTFVQNEGLLRGMLKASGQLDETTPSTELLVAEVLTNAAIEGERLNRTDVRSSINNQLGINQVPKHIKDQRAKGMAEGLILTRDAFTNNLTKEMLFEWHNAIMTPYRNINAGQWRRGTETMRILSGSIGKEVIHFEAPSSALVDPMMEQFIDWYNAFLANKLAIMKAPIFSAIAHLYFESIHPFEDGNGRIGRLLSIKALSQGIGHPTYLSISKAIHDNRQLYYDQLQKAQRTLDITSWISYFLDTVIDAQEISIRTVNVVLKKSQYLDRHRSLINERQEKVLFKMMDAEPEGFQGGMTAKKYMSITKTSKATATRDLQDLYEKGALKVIGAGRSTRYEIRLER